MRHQRPALFVIAALGLGLIVAGIASLATGDDDAPTARPLKEPAKLRLYGMDGSGGAELIVFLPSELLHPRLAPEDNSIRLECFDRAGKALLRVLRPWVVEPSEFRLLHFHQGVEDRRTLERIDRCRVTGTEPTLEGSANGMAISRQHPPYPRVDPAAEGLLPGE